MSGGGGRHAGAQFDGKRVVVTGASSGIGRQVARELARLGARILVVGRSSDRLQGVRAQIEESGGRAEICATDLADAGSGDTVVAAALEQLGGIDGLVHSAGVCVRAPVLDTTLANLDEHWNVNVRAPFALSRAAIPHLAASSGAIVFVSSVAARVALANQIGYATSKAAVEAMCRNLSLEVAGMGIRVNAVAPGFIETPMNESIRSDGRIADWAVSITPAARLGTTDDVAHAVVFLLSQAADFVHGTIVRVDGGYPSIKPVSPVGDAPR